MTVFVRGVLTLLLISLLGTCGRAQENVDSMIRLAETIYPDDSVRVNELFLLFAYRVRRDSTAAAAFLEEIERIATDKPDLYKRATFHLARGRFLRQYATREEAIAELEAAIALHEGKGTTGVLADVYYALGDIYVRAGNLDLAIEKQQQALALYRELDAVEGTVNALNSLGITNRKVDNLDRAAEYFRQTIDRASAAELLYQETVAVNNLAIIHKQRREFPQALELYERVVELSRAADPPDELGVGYAYNNISSAYSEMSLPDLGLEYAQKAYAIFAKIGTAREQGAVLLGIGTNLQQQGKYAEAVSYFRQAAITARDFANFRIGAVMGLRKSYEKLGVIDSVMHYYREEINLKAEREKKKNLETLAEMEAKFQTTEKQREIERLEYEDSLSQARITRLGWLLGLGALVLSVVGFLAYRLFHQRRRIQDQNAVISKSLAEKE
ncbi:MAG: tetratricopeptide repeat protein, partial [Bacteroidota bacterium]